MRPMHKMLMVLFVLLVGVCPVLAWNSHPDVSLTPLGYAYMHSGVPDNSKASDYHPSALTSYSWVPSGTTFIMTVIGNGSQSYTYMDVSRNSTDPASDTWGTADSSSYFTALGASESVTVTGPCKVDVYSEGWYNFADKARSHTYFVGAPGQAHEDGYPTLSITAGPSSVSLGGSVALSTSVTGNPAPTLAWKVYPPNGTAITIAETSKTISADLTGTWTVNGTATNTKGTASAQTTFAVTGSPPTCSFTTTNATGIRPLMIYCTPTVTGQTAYWWEVDESGACESGNEPLLTVFTTVGEHNISLVATNAWGTAVSTHIITVSPDPTPTPTSTPTDSPTPTPIITFTPHPTVFPIPTINPYITVTPYPTITGVPTFPTIPPTLPTIPIPTLNQNWTYAPYISLVDGLFDPLEDFGLAVIALLVLPFSYLRDGVSFVTGLLSSVVTTLTGYLYWPEIAVNLLFHTLPSVFIDLGTFVLLGITAYIIIRGRMGNG